MLLCSSLSVYRCQLVDLHAMSIPEVEPISLANQLRAQTRRMLGRPATWTAVAALAQDLVGWRRLTGDEAADTVQWTRRIHNQLTLLLPIPRAAAHSVGNTDGHSRAIGSQVA
jgi:hypothetical protein